MYPSCSLGAQNGGPDYGNPYLSAVRKAATGGDAQGRLPVLLRVRPLPHVAAAKAWGLLRLLFLRGRALSAEATVLGG